MFHLFVLVFISLLLMSCRSEKAFKYGHISSEVIKYKDSKNLSGKFPKAIFLNPSGDLEVFVSAPVTPGADEKDIMSLSSLSVERLFYEVTHSDPKGLFQVGNCPAELWPLKYISEDPNRVVYEKRIYTLFASAQYAIGACIPSQVAFRVSVVLLYCKAKNEFYEIKIFSKAKERQELEQLAKTIHCDS